MPVDFYGDAYKFNLFLNVAPKIMPLEAKEKLFSLAINAWSGEGTVLGAITYIAYFFQVTYKTAFIVFDAFFGGIYIFIWLHFVKSFVTSNIWRFSLILGGVTAPFLLLFFGHIEIYAPIICINLLWIYIALLATKSNKLRYLVLLVFILLLSIKLHAISVLCIPALALLLWNHFKGVYPSWKQIAGFILVPIFFAGSILYFFVFKDHMDNRSLQETAMALDHLFLPLFSPKAPLDNYNLLSFNHIFDFFSMGFLWSPIAIFFVLLFLILKRKEINWNAPNIKISGVSLFLFLSLFFVINPLLSMPIDWDLFSIPAIYLLAFTVALTSQVEVKFQSFKILYASLILAVLSLPTFLVHQSPKSISLRLETLSQYIYTSYYEWTVQTFQNALSIKYDSSTNESIRREQLLSTLKPKAKKGIDYEYTSLLNDQGKFFLRKQNNPKKALTYFKEAMNYGNSLNTQLVSLEAYFLLKQYDKAFEISQFLIQKQFPSYQKALKIGIHTALEAKKYDVALIISKQYLTKWPKNVTIQKVYNGLINKQEVDQLKFLFNR